MNRRTRDVMALFGVSRVKAEKMITSHDRAPDFSAVDRAVLKDCKPADLAALLCSRGGV